MPEQDRELTRRVLMEMLMHDVEYSSIQSNRGNEMSEKIGNRAAWIDETQGAIKKNDIVQFCTMCEKMPVFSVSAKHVARLMIINHPSFFDALVLLCQLSEEETKSVLKYKNDSHTMGIREIARIVGKDELSLKIDKIEEENDNSGWVTSKQIKWDKVTVDIEISDAEQAAIKKIFERTL